MLFSCCLWVTWFSGPYNLCKPEQVRPSAAPWFSFLAVAVTEVECVREGCQSEALRQLSGSTPDNLCFTVVFKGARKSLDLRCSCPDEAQRWVRGLRFLKERVQNMTQKEKLDQYPAERHFPTCSSKYGVSVANGD